MYKKAGTYSGIRIFQNIMSLYDNIMSLYDNNYSYIIFSWLESTCLSIEVIRKHKTIVQIVTFSPP